MTQTNQSYRQYLINNANDVMQVNLNRQSPRNTEYIYKSQLDNSTPYGYEHSDLKENYIRRQLRETAKAYAPIIRIQQYLKE